MSDPLFYDTNDDTKSRFRKKISTINPYIVRVLSIGMLVIIAFSIWFFYPSDRPSSESLPVIYAEKTPIRVKPDETDITVTADYNSRIYDTFGQSNNPQKIENLLKPQDLTEDPMPREELFAGIQPNNKQKSQVISITDNSGLYDEESNNAPTQEKLESSTEVSEETDEQVTQSEEEEEEPIRFGSQNKISVDVPYNPPRAIPGIFDSQEGASQIEEITENEIQEAETTEPAAGTVENVKAVEAKAPIQNTTLPSGDYYVQLASIQDKSRTEESWKKLIDKHSALSAVSYRTESAEIEGKGTFYRIQAGPLSKDAANTLCDAIKAQSGSCFVKSK